MSYKSVTTETFTELMKDIPPNPIEIVLYTGRDGKDMLDIMLNKEIIKMRLQWAVDEKKIDDEEFINLKSMIDSPDHGNAEIVCMILNNL